MYEKPFVMDLSSLINIRERGKLGQLNNLAENTLIKLTPGIVEELSQKADDIFRWAERYRQRVEQELGDEEKLRLKEVADLYGKAFRWQGRTRKALSDPDAEAVALATVQEWFLVSDDGSMRIVCQDVYGGTCITTNDFLARIA